MEFRRAKLEERVDEGLYERHRQLIFPLFHRRKLFAEVENFYMYDLFTSSGHVNEDVLAYSTQLGEQRALVVYHNRFGDTRGWLRSSVAYKNAAGNLAQKSLAEGLSLPNEPDMYVIFRDHASNREYIRSCQEIHENGLFMELYAYQAYVFLDFRLVKDFDGSYRRLFEHLDGRPAETIAGAMEEMVLQIIHTPLRELINPGMCEYINKTQQSGTPKDQKGLQVEISEKSEALLAAIIEFTEIDSPAGPVVKTIKKMVSEMFRLPDLATHYPYPRGRKYKQLTTSLSQRLQVDPFDQYLLYCYLICAPLGKLVKRQEFAAVSQSWYESWGLGKIVQQTFQQLGYDPAAASYAAGLVHLLIGSQDWVKIRASIKNKPHALVQSWLENENIRRFLGVNSYQGVEWFNQQAMENWLWWLTAVGVLETLSKSRSAKAERPQELTKIYDLTAAIQQAIPQSEYQTGKLLALLKPEWER
jgi:hypothetical protein